MLCILRWGFIFMATLCFDLLNVQSDNFHTYVSEEAPMERPLMIQLDEWHEIVI